MVHSVTDAPYYYIIIILIFPFLDTSYYPRVHPAPGPIVESGLVEVHNADSTTEIQERPSTSHATTPPNGQFFGNKIILGFKKKTPDDELQHEPRCFQTRLRLKDCMAMLSNSRRYCFKCQTLFPTPNLMYSHEMNTHSHLIEMDESSVSTEVSKPEYYCCKLCPSKFTRQFNLNKHYKFRHSNVPKETKDVCFVCHKPQASKEALIKHLYEKHYNNKIYTCQICSDQFKNKTDLEEHLYQHAKSKFKKKAQKPQSIAVLKGDQFKCAVCDLSFASKNSLRAHVNGYHNKKATNARKMGNATRGNCMYKCTICLNIFSHITNARRHFMQSHRGMPLTNSIRKVFNRKPSPSISTQSTDQSEVIEKPQQHMLNRHIIGNTVMKALQQSLSVSTDQSEATEKPAQQLIPKHVIFKCDTCPLCFMNNKDALDHRHHKVPFATCDKCHLCFPNNLMKLHAMQHGCTSKFQVISAFPNLRKRLLCKCPKCDIYFMETSLLLHLYYCKGDTKSFYCNVCQLNLNVKFMGTHLSDHAQFNKASDFIFVEYINVQSDAGDDIGADAELGADADEMPNEQDALLEKYKTLSTIWNVLYMCKDCSFVVDNYTMVIEHCHEHFVLSNNFKKSVTHCHTCDIDFEKITYGRHSKLHKSNNQVNGDSFNVLRYNYAHLYKKSWRKDLFADIPGHDIERLIRDSPYKKVRTIKLKMITTGTSQYTLYKCEQCRNVVQEKMVVTHALKPHDASFRRALISCTKKCNPCHLQFGGHVNWRKHVEMHKKFKIGVNFFTLISFNSTGDFQNNKMLKSLSQVKEFENDLDEIIVMHKCKKCGCATESKSGALEHSNVVDCTEMVNEYTSCSTCQLTFHKKEYFSHIAKHKRPSYRRENFKVILFASNKLNIPALEHVLYQCAQCRKCMRNKNRLSIHSCDAKPQICKKCGLRFSKNILNLHMRDHERLPRYNVNNITLVPYNPNSSQPLEAAPAKASKTKYILYQCKVCTMNMVSMTSAIRHCKQHCNFNTTTRFKCPKCALTFFHGIKSAHARMHLSHPNFNRQNIKIVYFDQNSLNAIAKSTLHLKSKAVNVSRAKTPEQVHTDEPESAIAVKTPARGVTKLYLFFHCQKCSAVMTTKSSAIRHTKRCHNKQSKTVCRICKYHVYHKQITKHMTAHRKFPDLIPENIEIFTFTDQASLTAKTQLVNTPKTPSPDEDADDAVCKFKLYQCTHCGMCFHTRGFVKRHYVSNCRLRPREKCELCGLFFARKALKLNKSHMLYHKNPEYTLDNIKIVPFTNGLVHHAKSYPAKFSKKVKKNKAEPESDANDESTVFDDYSKAIYTCEICAVFFPTKREAMKHADIKHTQCIVKSKTNCKFCGFYFPRTILPKHIQFHHTINEFSSNDLEVIPLESPNIKAEGTDDASHSIDDTITLDETIDEEYNIEDWKRLYKCSVCKVLFIKCSTLSRHCCERHTKCVIRNIRNCPECDLPFSSHSLKRHIEIHHDRFNLSSDDFTVLEGAPVTDKCLIEKNFLADLKVVTRDPLEIIEDEQDASVEPSGIESCIVTVVESDDL